MISQYFTESLPFSSPDEFPTRHNLSVSFSGLNDRRVANIIKRFARHRDYMRLTKFERVSGLDAEWKFLRCPAEHCLSNLAPRWANRNFGANRSNVVAVGID